MNWKSLISKIFSITGFEIYKTKNMYIRKFVSYRYLKGNGIEIGGLNRPLPLSSTAKVLYVDRFTTKKLKKVYPEVGKNIVKVDIIDDGEKLSKFKESSLDFIIANHFLEHCKNPIGAIENMLRVLKQDGILYMAIPDKRYTFDENREITTIEHLIEVYKKGEDMFILNHYEDWVKNVEMINDEIEFKNRVNYLINIDRNIHYHTWTTKKILELLLMLKNDFKFQFELEMFIRNKIEGIFILKKSNNL